MGNVFLQKKQTMEAQAFYGKFAHIWYKFLKRILQEFEDPLSKNAIDELLVKEALKSLFIIKTYFEQNNAK